MKHFISHQSALEYWRGRRKLPEKSADRRCSDLLPDRLTKIDPLALSGFEIPVHILTGHRSANKDTKIIRPHLFSGETPVGCFMNIGGRLMVSTPEFCFLQMADNLTLAKLIELGYELCGRYSIPLAADQNTPNRGFYNRPPLTSVKKLGSFIDGMPGVRGHQNAVRALLYIFDGSASPMETKLAMFLTLPYMLGGFGFYSPELNKRVKLKKTARKHFGKAYYVCDILWVNEKVAVEYDSDQQHTGSERIANDSKRRNALAAVGIRVVSVTKQQLFDSAELESVAQTIAGHLNKRLFSKKSNFTAAHRELRKQLRMN